jgi:molybdopterin synthase catalytic subunit/molybdopterin converting factor small subunit
MRVRLLFFAGLRDALGAKEELFEVEPGLRLGEVVARVQARFPAVAAYGTRLAVSLNEQRASADAAVGEGDEIAFLPPLSGGSGRERLQQRPLSLEALVAEVSGPDCGGLVTFVGLVRNHARGQAIEHLEYEAYAPMAEQELRRLEQTARERWPAVRLALAHRVGRLEIGELAVAIAAAAPHRADAFEACRFAIDELKRTVPIWKKEFAQSGAYWVEENP